MTSMKSPESRLQQITAHAERTYPEECCGVMLGREAVEERVVQEVIEIDNSQDANRRRRFLVSPAQYRDAERQAAERHMALLGFYHSHPDHPAAPSAFDTEHALPWFSYLIVSVAHGSADRATVWMLDEDRARFAEQALEVQARTERFSNVR
ncbi:M67 family peptidase [bacterium]|nr:MAG: M67 family peptidase [bacterium]